jgi:predicted N-acetyltransferase YhbS
MITNPKIGYIADAAVSVALDRELRDLLSTCFVKQQDHVFRTRRYFNTLPAHRWMIRDDAGKLAAHVAVHEKRVFAQGGRDYLVGGVAEVCVHPAHQGRGYAKLLVAAAHDWMSARKFVFSVLSGDSRHYASSGYRPAVNLFQDGEAAGDGAPPRVRAESALVACLCAEPWPEGGAYIPGPGF